MWTFSRKSFVAEPLCQLDKQLDSERDRQWKLLHTLSDCPGLLNAQYAAFTWLGFFRASLKKVRGNIDRPTIVRFLKAAQDQATREIQKSQCAPARASYSKVLELLASTEATLNFDPVSPLEPVIEDRGLVVTVPSDLLYHARDMLLPAERMGVVAGHRQNGGIRLGSMFEVTGEATMVHVSADPEKLPQALVAMTKAGCSLAAWIHSHPGTGAGATTPSSIDHAQHEDWLRHYPRSLLGIIVVADGWVRFFGTAIEEETVVVEIVGDGITQENDHGPHLYRLSE